MSHRGGDKINSDKSIQLGPLAILFMILALFTAFLTSVALNIEVARQALGFVYLTFIPGFLLLSIFRVKKLDWTESVSLCVGLSIAFLMLAGLFINGLGPLIGFSEPLSTIILLTVLNVAILSLCIVNYRVAKGYSRLPAIGGVKLRASVIVIFCLPFLSVAGTFLVNASPDNNLLLLAMLATISILVAFTASERLVPRTLYPLLLLAIAIALLLQGSLISSHINGFDIQYEYRFMETTVASSRWVPSIYETSIYGKFESLLSISILPTMYWNILNLDGLWVLKIIYPLIFAFVPLALYAFFKKWISERFAFLASFFFMAYSEFFTGMLTLCRQMIAELFFVLLLYVLFSSKIKGLSKTALFVLFSFGLIVSHYAISFIFLLIIISTWLIVSYLKRNYDVQSAHFKFPYVILYSTMMLCWYIYVSASATFNVLVLIAQNIYTSLFTDFFNPASRGATVLSGIGLGSAPTTFVQLVGRAFFYATEILIVVGFVVLIIKRKKIFDTEYTVILSFGIALLAMAVILPNFASSLGITRLYHIALLMSAPLCILGCEIVFGFILKSKNQAVTLGLSLIILIPFFLFQTGFVYEVAKVQSFSIPLSRYRFGFEEYTTLGMIDGQDIFSVRWLSKCELQGSATIYSDPLADGLLVRGGYGMFTLDRTEEILSNTTEVKSNSIVYLTWADFKFDIMANGNFYWNTSQYVRSSLNDMNQIYSNGINTIYQNP